MLKGYVSKARLLELLSYSEETGAFTWVAPIGRRVKPGALAGTTSSRGYVSIKIDGKSYKAHRLAWLWMHGSFPDFEIDHINGNKSDNRATNLRLVTRSENAQNQRGPRANSSSNVLGVFWSATRRKWRAQICADGKAKELGCFELKEDAQNAYLMAKRKLHKACTI